MDFEKVWMLILLQHGCFFLILTIGDKKLSEISASLPISSINRVTLGFLSYNWYSLYYTCSLELFSIKTFP